MEQIKLTFSQIRYIICLFRLSQSGCGVKNVDIANDLGFSKPSVHNMLKSLSELGAVKQEGFGLAFLTCEGRALAEKYTYCYNVLREKVGEICESSAVSENAICSILADMPREKIEELYKSKSE